MACKVASDHGHSQEAIATAAGCSRRTVTYSFAALRSHCATGREYGDCYQEQLNDSNKSKGGSAKGSSDDDSEESGDTLPPEVTGDPAERGYGHSLKRAESHGEPRRAGNAKAP